MCHADSPVIVIHSQSYARVSGRNWQEICTHASYASSDVSNPLGKTRIKDESVRESGIISKSTTDLDMMEF